MSSRYNLKNPNNDTPNQTVFGVSGWPTVSIQVIGTFTSGTYEPQVSNDGETWAAIPVVAADYSRASTIGATGMYRVDVNGFQVFRLAPTDVVGTLRILMYASMEPLINTGESAE